MVIRIFRKNRKIENAGRITLFIISYTLSVAQSNFLLMTLLINQWYLEGVYT